MFLITLEIYPKSLEFMNWQIEFMNDLSNREVLTTQKLGHLLVTEND